MFGLRAGLPFGVKLLFGKVKKQINYAGQLSDINRTVVGFKVEISLAVADGSGEFSSAKAAGDHEGQIGGDRAVIGGGGDGGGEVQGCCEIDAAVVGYDRGVTDGGGGLGVGG